MLYFELFDLKPSFTIDRTLLKKKYYALSKTSHPDFHTLAPTAEQEAALQRSTLVNLAYKVLSDENKLLEYVLRENGLLEEGENGQIPQDFLMEMMDINEAIMELELDPDPDGKQKLKASFETVLLKERMAGSRLKELFEDQRDQDLTALRDHYFKMKYLNRIAENL